MTSKLSREEVQRRLAEIGKNPPPPDLKLGAKCYKMASPPNRAEYLCPSCGQRTLYADEKNSWCEPAQFISRDLPDCRRRVKEIKSLDVTLDESEFCKKCSPAGTSPELILIVRYRQYAGSHRFRGIRPDDLVLIKEFTEGSDRHRSANDAETPMKDHLERLSRLLDVKN